MAIPEEVVWIQCLLDRYGVAGTLRLVSVNCADRAATHERWARLAEIVAEAAHQARRIEPWPLTR